MHGIEISTAIMAAAATLKTKLQLNSLKSEFGYCPFPPLSLNLNGKTNSRCTKTEAYRFLHMCVCVCGHASFAVKYLWQYVYT